MCVPTPLSPQGAFNMPFEALPTFPSSPITPPPTPTGGFVTPEQVPFAVPHCPVEMQPSLQCPASIFSRLERISGTLLRAQVTRYLPLDWIPHTCGPCLMSH